MDISTDWLMLRPSGELLACYYNPNLGWAGAHPKIVSERLGHTKVSITMDVYSDAMPTLQREAASKLASLVRRVSQ